MPRQITDHQMAQFSDYVTSRLGLHFPKKRWPDLERIINRAAGELGFKDAATCIKWLLSSKFSEEQAAILASHLTVGETYFFREPNSFDILENNILPELINSRRGKEQRLRIWSAGCSTGEEPYSIAILLGKMIPDLRDWNITILATDINQRALGKAAQGVYGEWSFRGVPDNSKKRFFTRHREGQYEVPLSTRKMVSFSILNLVEDPYPSLANNTNAMDIIFCRNVLMYFEAQQQQQVIQKFQRALRDGGWLVVSPCEASPAFSACFDMVSLPGAVFYRKGDQKEKGWSFSFSEPDAGPRLPLLLPQGHPGQTETSPPPRSPAVFPETVGLKEDAEAPKLSPYDEALELFRLGRYREAEERISALLDSHSPEESLPFFGKASALMAQILANRGEIVQALEWSGKAISADKLNAELYYLRATILQEQGEAESAIAALKKALYLNQNFILAHFALGTLAQRHGKAKEAGRHFDNALSLLGVYQADDPVPGSEGLNAGRLSEIIGSMRASMKG